jgi:hypothetical protein
MNDTGDYYDFHADCDEECYGDDGCDFDYFNDDYDPYDDDGHWNEHKFDELCRQLENDEPEVTEVITDFDGLEFAVGRLGSAMEGNTHLVHLEMTKLNLTEIAARALANGIYHSKLYSLGIVGAIIGSPTVQQILYERISMTQTIQQICLANVPTETLDGLDEVLVKLKQLDWLEIKEVAQWSPRHGQLVCDTLTPTSTITTLRLDRVHLGNDGFILVAQGLRHNMTLKSLLLASCGLRDNNIQLLIDGWHTDSPLECLTLANNKIGPQGAQLLLRAAAEHPALQELDLDDNKTMGFEGLKLIGEELPAQSRSLARVSLKGCGDVTIYNDKSCRQAQKQKRAGKEARKALMDGMKSNQSITLLQVFDPYDRCKLPWSIDFYNAINGFGRRLLLSMDHPLAPMVWCHVLAKCHRQPKWSTSFIYYFLCEQPSLVQPSRKRRRSEE